MLTMVIGTPGYKKDSKGFPIGRPNNSHSFETYLATGTGLGYELYPSEVASIQAALKSSSCKLVMLRNDMQKKRAEGRLIGIKQTPSRTKRNNWRYDVLFESQKEIKPYVYLPNEKLKHNGVKVF